MLSDYMQLESLNTDTMKNNTRAISHVEETVREVPVKKCNSNLSIVVSL